MKRTAYVFVHDHGHPKEKILPIIPMMFDYDKWHVCVMDSIDSICMMTDAPDLIVTFKMANSGLMDDEPNWYETSPFTYQWMKWVKENGTGLLVVHAGICFIPQEHPVMLLGVKGRFTGHPAMCPIHFEPVEGCTHPILEGIKPFTDDVDEHFQIADFKENEVQVLGYTTSESGGKQPSVWVNEYGAGRVAVILPGHANPAYEPFRNPYINRMLQNAVHWCGQEELES